MYPLCLKKYVILIFIPLTFVFSASLNAQITKTKNIGDDYIRIESTNITTTSPTYPTGYPKTMPMQNPLFWQFPSPVLNADGSLKTDGSTGPLYTADASARVWNIDGEDILFIYASHDMSPAVGCDRMDRYHVFSTTDMINWIDYGEILNADNVPWAPSSNFKDNSKFMWAPDCAYKNGKYYFYFPHPSKNLDGTGSNWGDNWKIGIATSDFPASDFTVLSQPLAGLPDKGEIDPCVFVDDDGQTYFYYGGGGRCYGGKLKDNMIELDGTLQEMQGLVNFHEAAWIHKYNGKYYLSHSDNQGNDGNQMKYAMSDSPLGPWKDMGVYIYGTGCGTNHGSIVEYKGQWYAVYHTDYVSNSGEAGRSVHVDHLYYNPDGSIQVVNTWGETYNGPHTVTTTNTTTDIALLLQAEDFNTNPKGTGYGYHDVDNTPRTTYRPTVGMTIEARTGGVYSLGFLEQKEFAKYTINVQKAGLYDIDCYVASANADGKFHLSINGSNKSGTVNVPNTGGWGDGGFTKLTVVNIPLKAGAQNLELRVENGGFNIDRFAFRKSAPYAGTPYNGPHNIYNGAVLQAEDFDNGGMGVAYYDTDVSNKSGAYRTTESVDLENSNGSIHISWSNPGEWCKYTINVTEQGIYDIQIPVSTGNGAPGSLFFTVDDVYVYPIVSINTGNWNTYQLLIAPNISLTTGTHVLTLNIGGNINVDKFTFVKISDIISSMPESKDVPSASIYPNPSNGIFNISTPQAGNIKIIDIKGSLIYENKLMASTNSIDITHYSAGIYFAILTFNNEQQRFKLIKK